MKININQKAQVQLTKFGADILNTLNRKANGGFLLNSSVRFRVDYTEGELYRNQLWFLFQVFGNSFELGLEAPFVDLEFEVGEVKVEPK